MRKILNYFKKTFKLIKEKKTLFTAILLLQLVFFFCFISIQAFYWPKIMDGTLATMDYLNGIELNEESLSDNLMSNQNLLGEDPIIMYRTLKTVTLNIFLVCVLSILSFIIFEGLLWNLTDSLKNKKNIKQFLAYFGKFSFVSGIHVLLLCIFFFFCIRAVVFFTGILQAVIIYMIFALILIITFFAFCSYALLQKYKIREIVPKTFITIKHNLLFVLKCFLLSILIISAFFSLMLLSQELNFILIFISVILFVFGFVFCRIFFYLSVNDLKV